MDAAGRSRSVEINAGDGNDTIRGGDGDDWLSGGAGADHIAGGDGNDFLFIDAEDINSASVSGGAGYDTAIVEGTVGATFHMDLLGFEAVIGSEANDWISGGSQFYDLNIQGKAGHDTIVGSHSDDVVSGDEGNDELHGGAGNDLLIGGAGNDAIYDSSGDDVMTGGGGDDTLRAGTGDDVVYGDDGNDDIAGQFGDDQLFGGNGDDTIVTGLGDDYVDAGAGNDVIYGDWGDEVFFGGAGNDTISSGHGDDYLAGGTGNDVFDISGEGQNYVFGDSGYDEAHFHGYASYAVHSINIEGGGRLFIVQGMNASGGWGAATILKDVERMLLSDGQDITQGPHDPSFVTDVSPDDLTKVKFTDFNWEVHGTWGGTTSLAAARLTIFFPQPAAMTPDMVKAGMTRFMDGPETISSWAAQGMIQSMLSKIMTSFMRDKVET